MNFSNKNQLMKVKFKKINIVHKTPTILLIFMVAFTLNVYSQDIRNELLFDDNWKFFLGEAKGAQKASFNDSSWRDIDVPHDWSIEKLPNQKPGEIVGPFSKNSSGTTATAYTLGGTAWYRKTFTLSDKEKFDKTSINFDGVYMNCEVWLNGKLLGTQPYGYTSFYFDITNSLNTPGTPNVIAVKVKNEGKNSRWYSGSGIYRHVWLVQKQALHIDHDGVFIDTKSISSDKAVIKTLVTINNQTNKIPKTKLSLKIMDPSAKIVQKAEISVGAFSSNSLDIIQNIEIKNPQLWSTESPNLYTASIEVIADGIITDRTLTTFGIRTISFDAENGFLLNGKSVLLKGGCLHHDNGFLGSATIDRAEERRVELMKAYGFNAIRTAHNPPSKQFLDACDRNGILVIDETFDMWERAKNPEDYHLYFKEWWKKDLKSLIYRDRNHPSVIMWSIGNELNERAESLGYEITKKLVDEVHRLDSTRPAIESICSFWDHSGQEWSTTAPAFAYLDVSGYNYMKGQYKQDHIDFPERVMVGTESYAKEAYDYWQNVKKYPWVIGDFVWTAMDYLGETGLGNARLDNDPDKGFLRSWPWFNGFSGDIDICGFKKPQLLYRDVIWDNSDLEMLVHTPIPQGRKELVSQWGWPNELPSWNWDGLEGEIMDVRVFSNHPLVRLELNGETIAEQIVNDSTKLIASFKVPYKPGILRAVAFENGIEVASKEYRTTGSPAKIKLTADRKNIKANRNDLSYVKVEIIDSNGNLIPNAEIPVTFTVTGVGEIAGSGSANPKDMESFNSPICKTYQGKALAILRPLIKGELGTITLKAEANGLSTGEIKIIVQ